MKPSLRIAFLLAFWSACSTVQAHAETTGVEQFRPLEPPMINSAELTRRMARSPTTTVLFDTRSRVEYDVSHLRTAIWLDPETPVDRFVASVGPIRRGMLVIFYCTMSQRSTSFAIKVMADLEMMGVRRVAVLKDGIIDWANAGFELVDAAGPTPFVHPFNAEATKVLKQPELARFTPRP